ncbi:hypothetical protein LEP1GSC060_1351 [Leptospira weilii serovar Ranarum str. ICFT]|uniref:Uncharacterized protein n=1 Tax=Leptospira weilii serovar Ranarum str. ICFT TaxID=1218598 RepID=N1WM08_9LEPT|nr:hypothetical protein LEP1GSC060_1351 [Leptospira weilii serovar Ranarum str. ICFT]
MLCAWFLIGTVPIRFSVKGLDSAERPFRFYSLNFHLSGFLLVLSMNSEPHFRIIFPLSTTGSCV